MSYRVLGALAKRWPRSIHHPPDAGAPVTNAGAGSAAGSALASAVGTKTTAGGGGGFTLSDHAVGVNLSGLQLGSLPGSRGTNYPSLRTGELDYWIARGVNSFRICTKIQRWMPSLGALIESDAASADHIGHIQAIMDHAGANGARCLIDFHDFGSMFGVKVSWDDGVNPPATSVTSEDLGSFMAQCAARFKDHPGLLGWDFMNEPNGMPASTTLNNNDSWGKTCQTVVDYIRTEDPNCFIYIPGNFFNKMTSWSTRNTNFHEITDPSNKLVFSAHAYFDSNTSGEYADQTIGGNGRNDASGWNDATDFLDWLDLHGKVGHIGEYGAPCRHATDGVAWRTLVDAFHQRCLSRGCSTMHAWSAGEWWASGYALRYTPLSSWPATSPDPDDTANGLLAMHHGGHFAGDSTIASTSWSIVAVDTTPDEGGTVTWQVSWTGGAIKVGERAVVSFTEGGTAVAGDWVETLDARLAAAATAGTNREGLIFSDGKLYVHSEVVSPITITRPLATGTAGETHDLTIAVDVGVLGTPTASITVQSGTAPTVIDPTNLVAEWRFDEGSGTTVADSSGNGLGLAFGTTAPTWTAEGLDFPADNSWAASPTMPSRVRGFDLVFRVTNTITSSSGGTTIFGRGDASLDHDGLRLGSATGLISGEIISLYQDSQAWTPNYTNDHRVGWALGGGSIAAGWHMFQADYDGALAERWKFYLDGVRLTSMVKANTPEPLLLVPMWFGRSALGNGFNGSIGYVNFYSLERGDTVRNNNRQVMIDAMAARGVTLP